LSREHPDVLRRLGTGIENSPTENSGMINKRRISRKGCERRGEEKHGKTGDRPSPGGKVTGLTVGFLLRKGGVKEGNNGGKSARQIKKMQQKGK